MCVKKLNIFLHRDGTPKRSEQFWGETAREREIQQTILFLSLAASGVTLQSCANPAYGISYFGGESPCKHSGQPTRPIATQTLRAALRLSLQNAPVAST